MTTTIQEYNPETWQKINMYQFSLFSQSFTRLLISMFVVNIFALKIKSGVKGNLSNYFLYENQPNPIALHIQV